jgi:hypothetical protein
VQVGVLDRATIIQVDGYLGVPLDARYWLKRDFAGAHDRYFGKLSPARR